MSWCQCHAMMMIIISEVNTITAAAGMVAGGGENGVEAAAAAAAMIMMAATGACRRLPKGFRRQAQQARLFGDSLPGSRTQAGGCQAVCVVCLLGLAGALLGGCELLVEALLLCGHVVVVVGGRAGAPCFLPGLIVGIKLITIISISSIAQLLRVGGGVTRRCQCRSDRLDALLPIASASAARARSASAASAASRASAAVATWRARSASAASAAAVLL